MDKKIKKVDPIRDNYFSTAEKADKFSEKLFYVGFIFSILVLMIDKNKYANLYDLIFYLFPVVVTAAFSVNLTCRFYLLPKASDKRALDFFSHVFDVELSSEKTIGYYNNDFKEIRQTLHYWKTVFILNQFAKKWLCVSGA